ncbi:hypothetical protein LIER_01825 [Lithospermum erythrorhizon]|uniref:Uncharacterized protein n=1 Tax=Lithospermum erythrorhizon TaxID=34254 RepID=A0AAV3NRW7_LITER
MSVELPVSTNILATTKLDIVGLTTKGSSWGNSNPTSSLSEKLISPVLWVAAEKPALRAYFLLAFEVSPSSAIPPEMVSTLPVIHGDRSLPLRSLAYF